MPQIEIAKKYYHALYSGDYNTVREVASQDMIFKDPSAPAEFYIPPMFNNLESFLKFMKINVQGNVNISIINSYIPNDKVVLIVNIEGSIPACVIGLDDGILSYQTQGVSVLHISNKKVIQHTDYMDYPNLIKSFKPIHKPSLM